MNTKANSSAFFLTENISCLFNSRIQQIFTSVDASGLFHTGCSEDWDWFCYFQYFPLYSAKVIEMSFFWWESCEFLSELNLRFGCLLPPCTPICVGVTHLILLIAETTLAVVTQVLKYFLKRVLYYRFTSISLVWKRDVNQRHCHFINCSYFQNHFYCYSLTN